MNEFETFYRQQIERLERELKRAKSDKERESIERELAVNRHTGGLEKMCLALGFSPSVNRHTGGLEI